MAAPSVARSLVRSIAALSVALLLVGCGDGPTGVSIADTQFASSLGVDLNASVRTASGLYYRDIVVGTGAAAAPGDSAEVRYELYTTNGQRQEAGTFSFKLGNGDAIAGFDEGITGMRVGGQRQLIVPPHLAYRDGMILVFNVQLLSIK